MIFIIFKFFIIYYHLYFDFYFENIEMQDFLDMPYHLYFY